ncbi:MAG: hypothetical protein AAF402_01685 [Pseudomonadota bacterium]
MSKKVKVSRRNFSKTIAAGTAVTGGLQHWSKPLVESAILPAHASSTPTPSTTGEPTTTPISVPAPTSTISLYNSSGWLDGVGEKGVEPSDYDMHATFEGIPTGAPRRISFNIQLSIDGNNFGSSNVVINVPDAGWRNSVVNAANSLSPFNVLSAPWSLTYNPDWEMVLSVVESLDNHAGGFTQASTVGAWVIQVTGGQVFDAIGASNRNDSSTGARIQIA